MILNKDTILNLLATSETAVGRALIVLNERQTLGEQTAKSTRNKNGEGFKPCDAFMGTSMAEFYAKYKRLSSKQLSYWRRLDKRGNPRIAAYWKQLLEIAKEKQSANSAEWRQTHMMRIQGED